MRLKSAVVITLVLLVGVSIGVVGTAGAGNTTETVYIATGENFPDALGAGPAAGIAVGPVLLVQKNAIPQATLDELNRLQPSRIVIVGGTGVVSASVQTSLEGLAFGPTVERVAGADRYETAAALSEATFPVTTGDIFHINTGTGQWTNSSSVNWDTIAQGVVIVPDGVQAWLVIDFSAESACYDGTGYCTARILVNGVEAAPAVGPNFAFDSTNGGTETNTSWEAHSMTRVVGPVDPGSYEIDVQGRASLAGATFFVDDWTLVIDGKKL